MLFTSPTAHLEDIVPEPWACLRDRRHEALFLVSRKNLPFTQVTQNFNPALLSQRFSSSPLKLFLLFLFFLPSLSAFLNPKLLTGEAHTARLLLPAAFLLSLFKHSHCKDKKKRRNLVHLATSFPSPSSLWRCCCYFLSWDTASGSQPRLVSRTRRQPSFSFQCWLQVWTTVPWSSLFYTHHPVAMRHHCDSELLFN